MIKTVNLVKVDNLNNTLKHATATGSGNSSKPNTTNSNKNSSAYTVSISQEAMKKLEDFRKEFAANATSFRGGGAPKESVANDPCWKNHIEMMRLDEPETYARYQELQSKGDPVVVEGGMFCVRRTEEKWLYSMEAHAVYADWFNRRCFDANGSLCNPNAGRSSIYKDLEEQYRGVTFDVYSNEYSESNAGISTDKLNVLLSVDMADALSKEADYPLNREISRRIEKAVSALRDVAGKCGGNLSGLNFGVKLRDDGSAEYHANYNWNIDGTMNADQKGVTAGSAEELLAILNEKEEQRVNWRDELQKKYDALALQKKSIMEEVTANMRRELFGTDEQES